jgi:hypothetical protein
MKGDRVNLDSQIRTLDSRNVRFVSSVPKFFGARARILAIRPVFDKFSTEKPNAQVASPPRMFLID